jgi:uncharacterized membrane protein
MPDDPGAGPACTFRGPLRRQRLGVEMMRMRAMRLVTATAVVAGVLVVSTVTSEASDGVRISTPYPSVAVEAGQSTTFDLLVTSPTPRRVELAVTQKPKGWTATLRGGGFILDGVFTDPEEPPQVQLEVEVPPEAAPGEKRVVVTATSAGGPHPLALELRVAATVEGGVELTTDFPALEGASDATFNFDLQLVNNTPQETSFNLEALGPEGWQIQARPAGQQQAATATVPGGSSSSISVSVDPPDDAEAGEFPVLVRAVGGGRTVETELLVTITGNFAMTLTTPDERLNAEVTAGGSTVVPLVISNDGTAPLLGVQLAATPPTGWEVTFSPETIPQIPPGQTARARATFTPSADAVAGDYVVTLDANSAETTSSIDIRTTVETSGLWGFVGVLLIVAAIAGLGYVFRRFGRR